jgi:hypothetical protein
MYLELWKEHPPDAWCKEHSSRPEGDTCTMWTDEEDDLDLAIDMFD